MKDYFYDDIQHAISRILEEQRQFSRMLEQTADPFREYREALEQAWGRATQFQVVPKNEFLIKDRFSISTVVVEAAIGRDAINLAQRIQDEFKAKLQLEVFEALHRPEIDTALASVLRHQEELTEITATFKRSFESITAPAQQIQSALATLEASARLYSAPAAHWSNSLSVVASYEKFAIRQTKKLEADTSAVAERRARVTELAGDLLVSSLSANAAVASESDSAASAIEPVHPRIFGLLNSHVGYVYRVSVDVDVELAVAAAVPTRICYLGGAIVMTVVRINETLRRNGGDDVFRSTNRSLWAASVISAVVVDAERDFAEIVDALFFLLYEGSGACSRLTSLVSEEDLQPLWRLKHLRLNYRHDIEHGDSKEIAKKHQKIGAAFIAIAGKLLPTRPAEWTSAQAELYQQLFDMLTKVEGAVNTT